jgi:hypothetical protein
MKTYEEIDALLDDPNTVHEIPNSASADPREITGFQARTLLSTITDRACRSAAERSAERILTRWINVAR